MNRILWVIRWPFVLAALALPTLAIRFATVAVVDVRLIRLFYDEVIYDALLRWPSR